MKKILCSLMIATAFVAMSAPVVSAQRHNGNNGERQRTERRKESARPSVGSTDRGQSGRPGVGSARPAGNSGNSRPVSVGNNRPVNGGNTTPAVNKRPTNNKPANNRPNVGSGNASRPGTSGRPGVSSQPITRPSVGNNRPSNGDNRPGVGNRPGSISNPRPGASNARPGVGTRPVGPVHQPSAGRPTPGAPRPPMIAPPHRPYRPVIARPHYRPVPPPAWRPRNGLPVIRGILGLTFGAAFNISLDYLYNNGYSVDGYGNNIVYLRNVPAMNYIWTDGALYYGNNGLDASSFYYSTPGYDMTRYNNVYSVLVNTYGMPVSVNNAAGMMTSTWFGGNNGYITLSFGAGTAGRYLTTLTLGM